MNREAWLTETARRAEALFRGMTVPPYRVTCGWPVVAGLARRNRRIGEYHYAAPPTLAGTVDL